MLCCRMGIRRVLGESEDRCSNKVQMNVQLVLLR